MATRKKTRKALQLKASDSGWEERVPGAAVRAELAPSKKFSDRSFSSLDDAERVELLEMVAIRLGMIRRD